jgi:hypothetical protein
MFSFDGDPVQEIEFIEGGEEKKAFMSCWERNLKEREYIMKEREKLVCRWMDIFHSISGSLSSSLSPFGLSVSSFSEELRTGQVQMQSLSRSRTKRAPETLP